MDNKLISIDSKGLINIIDINNKSLVIISTINKQKPIQSINLHKNIWIISY